jgi:hypothetical protein
MQILEARGESSLQRPKAGRGLSAMPMPTLTIRVYLWRLARHNGTMYITQ